MMPMLYLIAQAATPGAPEIAGMFNRGFLLLTAISGAGLIFALARHGVPLIFSPSKERLAMTKTHVGITTIGLAIVLSASILGAVATWLIKG
jgi:hypothetical protein